jgi:hypothetical protein
MTVRQMIYNTCYILCGYCHREQLALNDLEKKIKKSFGHAAARRAPVASPILDDGRWLDVPATCGCGCPVPGRPAHTSGWIGAEQSRAGGALGFSVPGVPAHCTRFIACAPAQNAGLPSGSVPSDSDLTTAIIDARTTGSQVVVDPAVDLPTPHRPFAAHSFPHRQTHTGSASCVRKPSQAKRVGGSSATVPRTHACAAQQAAVPVRLPAACNLRAAGAFPSGLSDRSGCRRTRTHLPPYMYAYGVLRTCVAHARLCSLLAGRSVCLFSPLRPTLPNGSTLSTDDLHSVQLLLLRTFSSVVNWCDRYPSPRQREPQTCPPCCT